MFSNKLNLIFVLFLIVFACSNAKSLSKLGAFKTSSQADSCTKGMGFNGICPNILDLSKTVLPSNAQTIFNSYLKPILSSYTKDMQLCIGDFSVSEIGDNESLSDGGCDGFPLMENDGKYGVIMASMNNVPCGSPQEVKTCIAFDNCGTVAIAVNGGTAQCVATYSTGGIASIISPLADSIENIAIGFSLKRKFTLSYGLTYLKGNDIVTKDVTTRGHFYFGMDLGLPFDFKIAGKSLEDIIQVDAQTKLLIDFGDVESTVSSLVPLIMNPTSKDAKTALKTILKSGAEVSVVIDSTITIGLNDLTKGLLNDFTFAEVQASLLITAGSKGTSGLDTGIYLLFDSDISSGLNDLVSDLFDRFGSVLGEIGVSKPKIPKIDLSLGMFITTEGLGVKVKFPGFEIACRFMYSTKKGSCHFNFKFFTAIIDGAKMVFKKASKFFDDAGEEIVDFMNDAGDFAKNLSNAVANKGKKVVNQIANATKDVANKVADGAKDVANKVADGAKDTAKKAKKALSKW